MTLQLPPGTTALGFMRNPVGDSRPALVMTRTALDSPWVALTNTGSNELAFGLVSLLRWMSESGLGAYQFGTHEDDMLVLSLRTPWRTIRELDPSHDWNGRTHLELMVTIDTDTGIVRLMDIAPIDSEPSSTEFANQLAAMALRNVAGAEQTRARIRQWLLMMGFGILHEEELEPRTAQCREQRIKVGLLAPLPA